MCIFLLILPLHLQSRGTIFLAPPYTQLSLTQWGDFLSLFFFQVFDGNEDQNSIAYNELDPPITARFIRFQPVSWYGHISMRVELYGCQGTERITL